MFYLGKKYLLDELLVEVLQAVNKFKITAANSLEVVTRTIYSSPQSCYQIPRQCTLVGDIKEVLKLVSEVKADPEDATNSFILHKLMISMNKRIYLLQIKW